MDRSGQFGKNLIYYQDNQFQLVFHVSNLIKYDKKLDFMNNIDDLEYNSLNYTARKKIIGNNYINIIWLENPYQQFNNNLIISSVIIVYIVISPINEQFYLIKLLPNKRSKFNFIDKIYLYFIKEALVNVDLLHLYL